MFWGLASASTPRSAQLKGSCQFVFMFHVSNAAAVVLLFLFLFLSFARKDVLAQLSKLETGDPRRPAAVELVTSNFDKFSDNGEVRAVYMFMLDPHNPGRQPEP